jgi:serine/threonine-protein kinase
LLFASWSVKTLHRSGAAPGAGEPEEIFRLEDSLNLNFEVSSFAHDGIVAIVTDENRETGYDILAVPVGGGESRPLVQTPSDEYAGRISPDGKWLAYGTDLTGDSEIWVRPYPDAAAGEILPLTSTRGVSPIWSRDGSELFYVEPLRDAIMAISVPGAEGEEWGQPEELFKLPSGTDTRFYHRAFDVAPDGRFIFAIPEGGEFGTESETAERPPTEIHVVLNWFEELKRLVPTGEDSRN